MKLNSPLSRYLKAFLCRLGIAVDPDWDSVEVPEQSLESITNLKEANSLLAHWKFCGKHEIKHNVLSDVKKSITEGECERSKMKNI